MGDTRKDALRLNLRSQLDLDITNSSHWQAGSPPSPPIMCYVYGKQQGATTNFECKMSPLGPNLDKYYREFSSVKWRCLGTFIYEIGVPVGTKTGYPNPYQHTTFSVSDIYSNQIYPFIRSGNLVQLCGMYFKRVGPNTIGAPTDNFHRTNSNWQDFDYRTRGIPDTSTMMTVIGCDDIHSRTQMRQFWRYPGSTTVNNDTSYANMRVYAYRYAGGGDHAGQFGYLHIPVPESGVIQFNERSGEGEGINAILCYWEDL